MRCDSLDQSCSSADDLGESHLSVPPVSASPQRQRSSSVHTLKYSLPQRVISCGGHSRSRSDASGRELAPEQTVYQMQAETGAEVQPVPAQNMSSLQVPAPEAALPASPGFFTSRAASPGPSSDPGPQLDDADEEVSRINSSVHTHSQTQLSPGSSHNSRHLSPGPGEHRSRLSQSVSPVSSRNRKQRMSPPPGEEPVTMATQLMDSTVELRRRTLSFDATSLSPHPAEGSSVDD